MSFFQSQKIPPFVPPPIFPSLQKEYGDWLTSQVGKGVPAYKGDINADPTKTLLPSVAASYQPGGPADFMKLLGVGTTDPNLQNMMYWGGNAGPASQYASLATQYGTPSQAGQYEANLAQYGISSKGSGQALTDWSRLSPQMAMSFLLPYAAGQNPAAYHAPKI